MKTITQNKLGLNGVIEKKYIYIKGLGKKVKNQKNNKKIKKHDTLQI
jgi:hypothetical protein